MTKFDDIVKLLEDSKIKYELIEHEPALTSQAAEDITGWSKHSGAKSIVFKIDEKFILCVVRGTNTVDFKKLREHFKVRKARLATSDEVKDVMGVPIGSCYPFPPVADVDGIIDHTFEGSDVITFSPGLADKHIRMDFDDYVKLLDPTFVDIYKE